MKYITLVLRLLLVLVVAGAVVVGVNFVVWAENPLGPLPTATEALVSTEQVTVTTEPWLTFTPRGQPPTVGFIFYPGGRVDPRSYAPAAQAIAAQGFVAVIVPMPLNLAVLKPDRALDVQQAHPEITSWAVGGHSLGGAMAARFARDYPARVQGLVLWAAYPSDDADLSQLQVPVLLLTGTNDGIVDRADLANADARLPSTTQRLIIDGGNHAQFGWYGAQPGDNAATISRAAQQQQAVAATLGLLRQVAGR